MSSPSKRRLMKDLHRLIEQKSESLFAAPLQDDLHTWPALIIGPKETAYENGTFSLVLKFTEKYPQTPPHVLFISQMFHPNIYEDGKLCLDILKNKWSPSYDVFGVLMSIQSLLSDPNVDSPANVDAAHLLITDIEKYDQEVRKTVIQSWDTFTLDK